MTEIPASVKWMGGLGVLAVAAGVLCVIAGAWQMVASGQPAGPARARAVAEAWSLVGTGASAFVGGIVMQAAAAGVRMLAELVDAARAMRGGRGEA